MMWSILSYTYSLSAHIIIVNSHTLHHSRYCHGLQCSLGCNTLPNRLGHSPSAQKPLHLTIFIFLHRQCLTIVHHFKLAIPCCSEYCQNTQEIWAHCCVPREWNINMVSHFVVTFKVALIDLPAYCTHVLSIALCFMAISHLYGYVQCYISYIHLHTLTVCPQ